MGSKSEQVKVQDYTWQVGMNVILKPRSTTATRHTHKHKEKTKRKDSLSNLQTH